MGNNPVTNNKKHHERSSPYPSSNLETALENIVTLKEKLGKGPYSRDEAAKALGYKGVNGISAGKIAACGYFGLLTRSGSSYSLSELADQIINYTSEAERQVAIVTACKTPALYNKLLQSYNEQALPQMLANILSRNYGIADKASDLAARTFRESVEFAGLMKNGIILVNADTSLPTETPASQENLASGVNTTPIDNTFKAQPSETLTRERGISESSDGWSLEVSCKYNITLPRGLRKKINELLTLADDIVDGFTELKKDDKNE